MNTKRIFILCIIFNFSCTKTEIPRNMNTQNDIPCDYKEIDQKIWQQDGNTMLFGGDHDSMHFVINEWSLNGCNLNFGIGREKFQALISPVYSPIQEVTNVPTNEQCVVLETLDGFNVYPYVTLSFHEAVNDKIGDLPILIAYCELADLAVVYETRICDQDLTFGVSGYTYTDDLIFNNIEAFVLWDRETESLWWPLIDMGVSGAFNGVFIPKYDHDKWEVLPWHEVQVKYPNAKVLQEQQQNFPSKDFKIDPSLVDC